MTKLEQLIYQLTNQIIEDLKANLFIDSIETVHEDGLDIVRVFVDGDHTLDLAEIVPITEQLQMKIQDEDAFPDGYYVEVSSLGVERPLKSFDDIKKRIGEYVYFELKEMVNHDLAWYGTIEQVENEDITLKINDRGRMKKVVIPYQIIKSARCAVKF